MKYDTTDFFQVYQSPEDVPEKKLLSAVLHRAVLDYMNPATHPKYRHNARRFFRNSSFNPMSLCWICHHLFEDSERMRMRILAKIEQPYERSKGIVFRVDTS